jgi:SPP1 family predicted phage head-tail adaptor
MSEFAGTLSERIEIERPVGARTPMGVQQSEWESVCSCLASIVPDGSGAEAEAQALSAMPRYRVTIRWRDGIAIDQRIAWRGRLLIVRQMLDDPRARERIVMRCEEVRQ